MNSQLVTKVFIEQPGFTGSVNYVNTMCNHETPVKKRKKNTWNKFDIHTVLLQFKYCGNSSLFPGKYLSLKFQDRHKISLYNSAL